MAYFSSDLTISIFVECWRVACAANAGINGASRLALTRTARKRGASRKSDSDFFRAKDLPAHSDAQSRHPSAG
jgi:hypothetical protein